VQIEYILISKLTVQQTFLWHK